MTVAVDTNIVVRFLTQIAQVIQWYENGMDFADALHLAQSQNYSTMYTFDEKFLKKAKKLSTQCEVKQA